MRPFAYTNPETVEEAIVLLGQNGHDREWGMRPLAGVQPLAGGTDLLTLMKADVAAPAHLVNLKRLTELPSGIEDTSEGLRLGALATLADIETHAVRRHSAALPTVGASGSRRRNAPTAEHGDTRG